MGEVVQRSLEDLIPVFENLERVQLFSHKEIKYIIRKCKDFEYKMIKNERQKRDFVSYIEYLIKFLSLIFQRRKSMKYWHKKEEIDKATSVKIEQLFSLACMRYKSDVNLWLSRINFAKNRKMYFNVSKLFLAMLQIHSNKENLWILAAKYEFTDHNSPDGARALIQRALRFMPKSKTLYLELFRFELLFIEKITKRHEALGLEDHSKIPEEVSDAILEGKLVELVFKQAMLEIPDDAEYCLQFIPICKQFSFASRILEMIFDHLNLHFYDKEERWQALIDNKFEEGLMAIDAQAYSKTERRGKISDLEEICLKMYQEAVDKLNSGKIYLMYMDFYLRLCEREIMGGDSQKIKKIEEIFIAASKSIDFLTEELIFRWMSLCDEPEHQTSVLSIAVNVYPKNLNLWVTYLKLMTSSGQESRKSMRKLFNRALTAVQEKESLPLWRMALDWTLVNCPDQMEKLFKASLTSDSQIASEMKVFYLEWSFAMNGIDETRKLYRELSLNRPNCLKFFSVYIKIESSLLDPSAKLLRRCFEDAVSELGQDNMQIWKDFMDFETNFYGGKLEERSKIYDRALKCLRHDLVELFIRDNALSLTDKKS